MAAVCVTVAVEMQHTSVEPRPSHPPFYRAGVRYTFKCEATGFPTPTVRWEQKPCTSFGCDKNSDGVRDSDSGWETVKDSEFSGKVCY